MFYYDFNIPCDEQIGTQLHTQFKYRERNWEKEVNLNRILGTTCISEARG